jgi:replicative DNA helicase
MPKPTKDLLPTDPQLEREILGSLFGEDSVPLLNARAVIAEDDFSLMDHRRIFQSLCRLADAGKPRTRTEVYADLQAAGSPVTLGLLVDLDDFAWALDRLLMRLRDLSRRRKLIFHGQQLMASAADLDVTVDDAVMAVQGGIRAVCEDTGEQLNPEDVAAIVEGAGGLQKFLEPKRGIRSPWGQLDQATGGWQHGELILIAARPSMGKTAFALNALVHCVESRRPAVFYSFEMSKESIVRRLISLKTGITYMDLIRGNLNLSERRLVSEAMGHLTELPLRIVQASGRTVLAVRIHAERLRVRGMCDLIAVDYIGLVRGAERSSDNRNRELGQICRQLKETATGLGIPALVLSQLSRATEMRSDKKPQMSDLRDSGELEEHADVIAFLHRPGYYNREDPSLDHVAELIISKQRNGDTPVIPLEFYRQCGRFESVREENARCA